MGKSTMVEATQLAYVRDIFARSTKVSTFTSTMWGAFLRRTSCLDPRSETVRFSQWMVRSSKMKGHERTVKIVWHLSSWKAFWRSLVAHWRTAWRCEREKSSAHLFKRKIPVNYRSSSKKHFKFPGKIKPREWISSFALEKTTLFSKRSQPLARFSPPTGCLRNLVASQISYWSDLNVHCASLFLVNDRLI